MVVETAVVVCVVVVVVFVVVAAVLVVDDVVFVVQDANTKDATIRQVSASQGYCQGNVGKSKSERLCS